MGSTEKENDLQATENLTQMALFVVCKSVFISVLTNLEDQLSYSAPVSSGDANHWWGTLSTGDRGGKINSKIDEEKLSITH